MTRDELIEVMWEAMIRSPNRDIRVAIEAAIAAIEAQGMAIVPVEATEAMMSAAWNAMFAEPYDCTSAPMIGAGCDAAIKAGKV